MSCVTGDIWLSLHDSEAGHGDTSDWSRVQGLRLPGLGPRKWSPVGLSVSVHFIVIPLLWNGLNVSVFNDLK